MNGIVTNYEKTLGFWVVDLLKVCSELPKGQDHVIVCFSPANFTCSGTTETCFNLGPGLCK